MFDVRSFEAKNKVFEFDHQQMNTFEFVRCSKNDVRVRTMFDKMVFDTSLRILEKVMSMIKTAKKVVALYSPFSKLNMHVLLNFDNIEQKSNIPYKVSKRLKIGIGLVFSNIWCILYF